MMNIKGKYANAKIFTDLIDDETVGQVIGVLNSPVVENQKVRIMPDCHAGAGCVVGTTMTIGDKIIPNLVGVDIGCGMLVVELGHLNMQLEDLKKLDEVVQKYVPAGFNINEDSSNWKYFNSNMKPEEWFKQFRCYKYLKGKETMFANSLGSLGGGNHFVECDKDDNDNYYLVIHSGSRNLGLVVATYYQNIAIKSCNDKKEELQTKIEEYKQAGKFTEISNMIKEFRESHTPVNKDLCYLTGKEMEDYLYDMELCQKYASASRKAMAINILSYYFNLKFWKIDDSLIKFSNKEFSYFETIHNYINFEDNILRKGAVSARLGEKLLIPMNMRDGSLVCVGKGNDDWNQSAPHGAGRLMSRREAKEQIDLKDFEDSMQGIYSTTVNQSTLDESPMAYKPMDSIVNNIKDTVKIINIIKPVYNFKASC